jgi:hypothetical protein
MQDNAEYGGRSIVADSAEYVGQCRTVQNMEDNAGQCRILRTFVEQCRTLLDIAEYGGQLSDSA